MALMTVYRDETGRSTVVPLPLLQTRPLPGGVPGDEAYLAVIPKFLDRRTPI
jgi:hypothetical protein